MSAASGAVLGTGPRGQPGAAPNSLGNKRMTPAQMRLLVAERKERLACGLGGGVPGRAGLPEGWRVEELGTGWGLLSRVHSGHGEGQGRCPSPAVAWDGGARGR